MSTRNLPRFSKFTLTHKLRDSRLLSPSDFLRMRYDGPPRSSRRNTLLPDRSETARGRPAGRNPERTSPPRTCAGFIHRWPGWRRPSPRDHEVSRPESSYCHVRFLARRGAEARAAARGRFAADRTTEESLKAEEVIVEGSTNASCARPAAGLEPKTTRVRNRRRSAEGGFSCRRDFFFPRRTRPRGQVLGGASAAGAHVTAPQGRRAKRGETISGLACERMPKKTAFRPPRGAKNGSRRTSDTCVTTCFPRPGIDPPRRRGQSAKRSNHAFGASRRIPSPAKRNRARA